MLNVSLDNVDETLISVRETLGERFVSEFLDRFDPNIEDIHRSMKMLRSSHPLALWWYELNLEFQLAKKKGKLSTTNRPIRLLKLVSDLIDIEKVPNFSFVLDRIHNRDSCYSAIYESDVLARYVAAGFSCQVIDSPRKACDFLVTHSCGMTIEVECKSVLNRIEHERLHWEEINHKIADDLFVRKKPLNVHLKSSRLLSGNDIERIRGIVLRSSHQRAPDGTEFVEGDLSIRIRQIAQPDELILGEFSPVRDTEQGRMRANMVSNDGKLSHFNPVVVQATPFYPTDYTNTIITALRKASKQTSGELSAVVHVQIPIASDAPYFSVVDASWSEVFRRLKEFHSNISVVCIDSFSIAFNGVNNHPILPLDSVIPNLRAKYPLHRDVALPGWIDRKLDISPDEGYFVMEFSVPDVTDLQQRGVPLFQDVSQGGIFQLWIRRKIEGSLRVEIVTPTLGRLVGDFQTPHLVGGRPYKLAASWASSGINMAVDGVLQTKMLEN